MDILFVIGIQALWCLLMIVIFTIGGWIERWAQRRVK